MQPVHDCRLAPKDTSGLPRLPPNASWFQLSCRRIRNLFLLNPHHIKCKKLFRNRSAMLEERKRHAISPYTYVVHPLSTISAFVEATFFAVWFYSLIMSPLSSFDDAVRWSQYRIVLPIRLVLIVLFFNIGYIDKDTNNIFFEPKKIFWKYVKTYFFIDVLSTELIYAVSDNFHRRHWILINWGTGPVHAYFGTFYALRTLATFVRIRTLLSFLSNTLDNLRLKKEARIVLVYVIKTFTYVHLFAVSLITLPYLIHCDVENDLKCPPESWIGQANVDLTGGWAHVYAECFLMSISFFFGISYRYNIILITEQMITVVIAFFGRLYTLYLLADILNMFGIIGVSESKYEGKMSSLLHYMSDNYLPDNLRQRMLKYYEFKFQKHYFNEPEILSILSQNLRTELFLFSARKLIQKVEIFKKLPASTLGAIIACMSSETYSPGEVIIKLGAILDHVYFISTGTVTILNSQGIELVHLEDGDIFGTSCIIQREQTHVIAAVETTEIFTIQKNQFIRFLEPFPEVMHRLNLIVKDRFARLKVVEEKTTAGTIDILTELHRGNILEAPAKRLVLHS